MAKLAEDIQEMSGRAQQDAARPVLPDPERRQIYSGDPQRSIAGYAVSPNRKGVRRPRSTFNIIAVIFLCGVAVVLYISNILAVNRIAAEVNAVQVQLDRLVAANQILRAEIDRKSRWERIGRLAAEMGLQHPGEQPAWFDVEEYGALSADH